MAASKSKTRKSDITAQRFVDAYFKHMFNGTKAILELHPTYQNSTAQKEASKWVRKPVVQELIRERMEAFDMGANEAWARYLEVARGDLGEFIRPEDGGETFALDLLDDNGEKKPTRVIKEITAKKTRRIFKNGTEEETQITKVKLHDSKNALENILRVHDIIKEPSAKSSSENSGDTKPFKIPPELIAPSFDDVYRDIQDRAHVEYVFRGGRGSTKSSFISEVIIEILLSNPNIHCLATRQVGNTLRDSVFSQLRWAIMEMGLEDKFKATVSPLEVEYKPTGQKIYFRGGDDPIKIKSIKPSFGYIGILWFEELDQFKGPEAVRNIEQSAIRGGDLAFILKSFNPPRTANNWANKYCKIPKKNQYQHFSNYLGLPEKYFADETFRESLPEEVVQYIIDKMRVPVAWLGKTWLQEAEHLFEINPKAANHEYGGIATGTGGMVFENVIIRPILPDEIATFNGYSDGIDWGYFPDPFVWGRSYYDPARLKLYIFDEYYVHKKSNRATWKHLFDKKGVTPEDLILADNAEPKSIADYRAYGANIKAAEKGPDSVDYSMKWLQSLAEIVIDDRRAPYHADEFLNYELEQDSNGDWISSYPDKNNHCIDAIRYAHNLVWRRRGK